VSKEDLKRVEQSDEATIIEETEASEVVEEAIRVPIAVTAQRDQDGAASEDATT